MPEIKDIAKCKGWRGLGLLRVLILIAVFLPAFSFADDIYLDQTYLAIKAKQEVFFSLGASMEQPLIMDTAPTGSYNADLEWNFSKTYSVGSEFSYHRPFEPEDDNYNGWNDLIFYFTDKELFANHKERMTIAYKISAVFPISEHSYSASLLWGSSQQILFRKGFGKASFMYAFDLQENFYTYDTVDSASPVPKYNSPMAFANRVIFTYTLLPGFRWQSASQIRTSTDYNNSTSSTYSVSGGLAVDVMKDWTINTGMRTSVKDTGVPTSFGSSDPTSDSAGTATDPSGFGGHTGNYLFDPYGTLFYVGTTIRI